MFDIPVETGVRSLQVFAGVQRKDLAVLMRPDGTIVREHDQATAVQSFQHMLIATVEKPAPGIWHLELHGAGTFCVTAHVQPGAEGVGFDKATVKKDGTCSVEVSGNAEKLQLEFVAKDGTVISRQSVGQCTVPKVPFRIAITGVDANGKEFRRIERALRQ